MGRAVCMCGGVGCLAATLDSVNTGHVPCVPPTPSTSPVPPTLSTSPAQGNVFSAPLLCLSMAGISRCRPSAPNIRKRLDVKAQVAKMGTLALFRANPKLWSTAGDSIHSRQSNGHLRPKSGTPGTYPVPPKHEKAVDLRQHPDSLHSFCPISRFFRCEKGPDRSEPFESFRMLLAAASGTLP